MINNKIVLAIKSVQAYLKRTKETRGLKVLKIHNRISKTCFMGLRTVIIPTTHKSFKRPDNQMTLHALKINKILLLSKLIRSLLIKVVRIAVIGNKEGKFKISRYYKKRANSTNQINTQAMVVKTNCLKITA